VLIEPKSCSACVNETPGRSRATMPGSQRCAAGEVIVWDRGTWLSDAPGPAQAYRASGSRAGSGGRLTHAFQQFLQDHGVVAIFIPGRKQQGKSLAALGQAMKLTEGLRSFGPLQFHEVAPAKLRPGVGMGVEPGSQLVGGSEVLEPCIQRGSGLGEPAGPETIHQNARAVRTRRAFIDALGHYRHGAGLLYCTAK
jgi:hypothetical protein